MNPEAARYIQTIKHNDSWNHEARIDFIAKIMQTELDLKGKRVLDLGCRFGLYSYLALQYGAAYVVGVDIENSIIERAEDAFRALEVDSESYCFSCNDIAGVNFHFYDIVLAFGILYNIPDHERYLKVCRYNQLTMVAEFWTKKNTEFCPVLWWPTDSKIEELGHMAGKPVVYQQYVPNLPHVNMMFARCGYKAKQLNQPCADHSAIFFLLTPDGMPESNMRRWGMTKWTTVPFI